MDHSGGFGGPQFSQTFHGVCWSIIIFPREDRATVRYPSSLHGFAISTLSQQAVTTLWALHSWGINMCSITMTYSRHIYIYAYILEKLKLHKYKKKIFTYIAHQRPGKPQVSTSQQCNQMRDLPSLYLFIG